MFNYSKEKMHAISVRKSKLFCNKNRGENSIVSVKTTYSKFRKRYFI